MKNVPTEVYTHGAAGFWKDEIYKKDESGTDVLVKETEYVKNVITQPFSILVAALLANDPSMLGGVLYHAIGEGLAIWDTSGTPLPSRLDTQLVAEFSRLSPDGISYVVWCRNTADSGDQVTIVDSDRFEPDGFFDGQDVRIIAGTNTGETRTILSYTQATGTFVVSSPFSLPIDSTSVYEVVPVLSMTPTNSIEVRTTWDYGLPSDAFNYKYIREQGLFGGTATATINSGMMMDHITHNRIWKDPTFKVVRRIVLSFGV